MSCPRCEQGSPCGRDCDPDDDWGDDFRAVGTARAGSDPPGVVVNPPLPLSDLDADKTPVMSQDLSDVAEWLSRQGRGFVAQMITDGSWRADLYRMRGGK